MPYIKQEAREKFRHPLFNIPKIENAGEFNYVITSLMRQYIRDKGISYQNYNDLMGALEGAKMELYRTEIAPYEEAKIAENGDA